MHVEALLEPPGQPFRVEPGGRGAEVIAEFKAQCANGRYDELPAHHQPFETPYVVRHRVAGVEFDVLIANENAMHWYEDPDRVIATAIYTGEFEVISQSRLAKKGDVVFDCGAHHGVLAGMIAKLVGPTGHVYAFEPSLIGADLIELNARLNGLENVTAIRAGVGDRRGTGRFSEREARLGIPHFDAGEVPEVVLDDYADRRPALLKIDVEGAEGRVLAGAQRVLEQAPNLMLELHPQWLVAAEGWTQDEVMAKVDWSRYECFQAIGDPPYNAVDWPRLPDEGGWVAARRREGASSSRRGRRLLQRLRRPPAARDPQSREVGQAEEIRYDLTPLGDDPLAATIRRGGEPGGPAHDAVLRAVAAGARVLDLGARIGSTSLRAAAAGAQVIALEADPAYAASLRSSAQLNSSSVEVVHAMPAAAPGTVQFSPAGPWGHVRKVTEIDDILAPVEVEAVRVDDVLANAGWDGAEVVKLTLSGYEPEALEGMAKTLGAPGAPQLLVVESNAHALSWYDRTPQDLWRQLADLGFEIFLMDGRSPGRVISVEPDDIQPECVSTVLAAREVETARDLGYEVDRFGDGELLERLLAACASGAATDRWHAARELERGPAQLRDDRDVREVLERLQLDPTGIVRDAVWWANEAQPGADAVDAGTDGGRLATMEVPGAGHVTLVLPAGPADPVAHELRVRDGYPPSGANQMLLGLVRPGISFVDLGSNVGTFTLPAAALGATVLAVDAHPEHVRLLDQAVERNGFDDRVTVLHAAVAAEPGELDLVCMFGWSFIAPAQGAPGEFDALQRVTVAARPVRDLLREAGWDKVDLIKMDVEGSETRAIAGMAEFLSPPDAPTVLLELCEDKLELLGSSVSELLTTLDSFGYRVYKLEQSEERILVPISPSVFLAASSDDALALKSEPEIEGWRVREPLSRHDQVDRVVEVARSPFRSERGSLVRRLEAAPPWLLRDPLVREALRALRHDVHPEIRSAAAWSQPRP